MRYIVLLLIIFISFSLEAQENPLLEKLCNSKELFSIDVLIQKEYDSIAKEVKHLILNSDRSKDLDGFIIKKKE